MTLIELVVAAGSAELLALVVMLGAMVHRPRVRLRLGREARQPEVGREGARVVGSGGRVQARTVRARRAPGRVRPGSPARNGSCGSRGVTLGRVGKRMTPSPGNRLPRGKLAPGALTALLRDLVCPPSGRPRELPVLHPGQVVGRFEILHELGHGGFGVVYEATDRELLRNVALKVIRVGEEEHDREERSLQEAEAAAQLSHPNIVTLFDVGRCEQGPYLVLELLRGQTLASRLAQGAVPVLEALRLVIEVAKGLAHAHRHGVVHRDLTPRNVFLCRDGQVKVFDFGMARAFGRRTIDGGTRGYMAPEQVRGAPEDERTDVYALGIITHQMLTGEAPAGIVASRRTAAVRPPGPPSLGRLLRRMLHVDPVKRPRDGDELVSVLTAIEERLRRGDGGHTHAAPGRARPPRSSSTSIAVLPFANMSSDPEQEYFSDGLTEEILNALAHVDGLHVVGRTSSFSFRGKSEDARAIGRKLGVGALLEGSVRKAGGRVRVSAQLVDAASGFRTWSETYDHALEDVFGVQDDVASSVAGALRMRLLRPLPPARRERRVLPEVYNRYLLARHLFNRGTDDGLRRAIAAYESALALDPGWAPAHASLAVALFSIANLSGGTTLAAVQVMQDRAMEAAERAVALDPGLAEGHAVRGRLRTAIAWDWAGAKADFEEALASKPGDALVQGFYGKLLAVLGKLPEAIEACRAAVDLDPLNAMLLANLGASYNASGQSDLARDAARRALEIEPEHSFARMQLGLALLLDAEPGAALAEYRRNGTEWVRLTGSALAHHDLAQPLESQESLDALVARWGHLAAFQVAEVHAWRGDRDRAFEWLERARAQRDPGVSGVKCDVHLRHIRSDPRYATFVERMNLPPDEPERR